MAEGDVAKALTMKGLADAWAKEGLGLVGKALMAPINASQDILQNYRPGPQNEVVNQDIGRQGFDAATAAMAGAPFAEVGAVGAMGGKPPRQFWHGTPAEPFTTFKPSEHATDTLGPASYLTEHKAGAQTYADQGAKGNVLGPFRVEGNMVELDTHIPWRFNPDGSVAKTAPARTVLSSLERDLIQGRREPWGQDMTPAEYTREYMKRRGVDAVDSGGGAEVAVYNPANILDWDTPLPTRVENPIKAYHGSPHDFDKFDAAHIGKGEGAQAYGHGLYFAENENVARSYKPDSDLNLAANRALNPFYEPTTKGHVYEVNLHATPEQFLDWDKPLTQQSDTVMKALRDAGFTQKALDYKPSWPKSILQAEPPGSSAYYALAKKIEPDMASHLLSQHGIPGIRYADQWTRDALNQRGVLGQGKGTHNYVVFPGPDGKGTSIPIDIVKKYGIAGLLAAGAAMPDQGENH